mgnify:FL=1
MDSLYRSKGSADRVRCGKYRLIEEHDPSGMLFQYTYDHHNKLSSIKALNQAQELIHTVKINETSDCKTVSSPAGDVTYQLRSEKRFIVPIVLARVQKIESSQKGPVSYVYDEKNRISEKLFPEGRKLLIEYYDHGENKDKVKALKRAGDNGVETLYTFSYRDQKDAKYTSVIDAKGNKSIYYQENNRLSKFEIGRAHV